jgi:hypothetical protein
MKGQKHGEVNNWWSLSQKMTSRHKLALMYWIEMLFFSLISIRIFFYFILIKLKNHIFYMHLNRFQINEYTCIDVWVLQNWL